MNREKGTFVSRLLVAALTCAGLNSVVADHGWGAPAPQALDAFAVASLNLGVGFSYLVPGGHTLAVKLTGKDKLDDRTIEYSTWETGAGSGLLLWNPDANNVPALTHQYHATGVMANQPYGVCFWGTLRRPVGDRPATPPNIYFRDSLADLVVAIDSGIPPRHVANPTDTHWTPDLSDTAAHDNQYGDGSGGMGIPPSLWSGTGFPATKADTDGTPYKIAMLRLRTNWQGHPGEKAPAAPQYVGSLFFQFSAPGVAIYGDDFGGHITQSSSAQARTMNLAPPGSCEKQLRILTNDQFTAPCTVTITFSWDSAVQGGPYTVQDKFRLFPQQGWEYNQAQQPGLALTYSAPSNATNTFYASPTEGIIFNVEAKDLYDLRRPTGSQGEFTPIPVTGPYKIVFTCNGNARFKTLDTGDQQLIIDDLRSGNKLRSGNVFLYANSTWQTGNIVVTATVQDLAQATVSSPDTGTLKDNDLVHTWTFQLRQTPPPYNMRRIGGTANANGVWSPDGSTYVYQGFNTANDPPGLPPYYQGQQFPWFKDQVVKEYFSNASALGFGMNDLKTQWKAANPQCSTPDLVAKDWFGYHNNSSFSFHNNDEITDQFTGFTAAPGDPTRGLDLSQMFTPAALNRGVGYYQTQNYVCYTQDGTAIILQPDGGLLSRLYQAGVIWVSKSAP